MPGDRQGWDAVLGTSPFSLGSELVGLALLNECRCSCITFEKHGD